MLDGTRPLLASRLTVVHAVSLASLSRQHLYLCPLLVPLAFDCSPSLTPLEAGAGELLIEWATEGIYIHALCVTEHARGFIRNRVVALLMPRKAALETCWNSIIAAIY